MARKTDMMHFRLDPELQRRLAAAVTDHAQRFESQSHVMRLALRYYLNRLEAGVLDREPDPEPPTPKEDRRLRAVPPATRSTDVAG